MKYKNYFSVTGPESLLIVFSEELKKLGYVPSDHSGEPEEFLTIYGKSAKYEGKMDDNKYCYHPFSYGNECLNLPENWNRALQLASEETSPMYKKGDWVITKEDSESLLGQDLAGTPIKIKNISHESKHGASFKGVFNEEYIGMWMHDIERYATETEIKNYLVEECDKRFNAGDSINGLKDEKEFYVSRVGREFNYDFNKDILYSVGYGVVVVYENGIWATKRKVFKLYNYEMRYDKDLDEISFGCTTLPVSLLRNIVEVNKKYGRSIEQVVVKNYTVSEETIKEILTFIK